MGLKSWNVRGFNSPLTQDEVFRLIRDHALDVLGVLETKAKHQTLSKFVDSRLKGWLHCNNLNVANRGRIAIFWNPNSVSFDIIELLPQVIHAFITCKISGNRFLASFVYGVHLKADRRPLWANLVHTRTIYSDPWLLLGDFNSVLKSDERRNGSVVSPHEIKDFEECCFELGISDLQFTGLFYTWTNMTVWSKLDCAMVDHNWILAGFNSRVEFLPSGSSDHSPCVVSLFDIQSSGKTPWRFFNMLAEHQDFHQVVQDGWQSHYRGTTQFVLCQQLKGLKDNLKALNEKHFSHISSRAKNAKEKLKETQKLFHDFPHDLEIRSQLLELRKSSLFLSIAKKLFYQQKAKCNYLIQSDKCTRFFQSIVKKNAKKNFIASIVCEDGNSTVSQDEVSVNVRLEKSWNVSNLFGEQCHSDILVSHLLQKD
ncbi:hypothetical protein DH2020_046430 [Rehmannia glutinosa]|uniref:Endonuclease/exonuclease/phosphatase domain-containing protein n=1 Tax=Rehmannia glutinosa TaxID=99300 RepID=A0ABR0UC99_REHGL